jgi:hypothetical protein
MKPDQEIPEISDIVKHWMPEASEEEQKEATKNVREHLAVVYRIFLRLEREGKMHLIQKDPNEHGKVEAPK